MADNDSRDDAHPLAGERIVCISSIDWDFNWQGHQEIMAALASEGSRVLFVENTGVRASRRSGTSRGWPSASATGAAARAGSAPSGRTSPIFTH